MTVPSHDERRRVLRSVACAGLLAVVTVAGVGATQVTFLRVSAEPGLGRLDFVLAVTDLNGDGRDDIVVGGREESGAGATTEERWTRTALRVLVGEENGSLTHAPQLVEGTIEARSPVVVADDFNGDTRPDLAVFDAGVYSVEESLGYGNPPQLFLSSPDGRLRPSDALAEAVRREHELRPQDWYSGPTDLHIKTATSGDIDGDGDVDLWVESTGGANVPSHFMMNDGDGTFSVDTVRAPHELLHNPEPEFWRHYANGLIDLDNDGDLDLVLGQMRDLDPTHVNQFSIALLNDGAGHYPHRIELPHPAFNDAYTEVNGLTAFDVNDDGFRDLLLVHTRNDDGPPDVIPWTGRYIQVLLNRRVPLPGGGLWFGDETTTWMGNQSATTPEQDPYGDLLINSAEPRMHDVDRDGCADLVMWNSYQEVSTEAPLVYRNNGSGQFEPMPPEPFTAPAGGYFGLYAVPADVDGDALIDFVAPQRHDGPDGIPRTEDDFTTLLTLLNATPVGPVRCD